MTWLKLDDTPLKQDKSKHKIELITYMTKLVIAQYPNGQRYIQESKSWEIKGFGGGKVYKKPKKEIIKEKISQAEDLGVEEI